MVTLPDDRLARMFRVPFGMHLLSGLTSKFPRLWTRLGDLETWTLRDQLAPVVIDRPIYVAGLARSGSTILLEILASHPDVVTHQYRDFPALLTPYWWGTAQQRNPAAQSLPVERAHADGLMVTPASPEAMEEVLWMTFFPRAHDPHRSHILEADTEAPQFEQFYRDHIRKLLLLRGGRRYASKDNYNVTRLPYLKAIFPEARFVVPIRHPRNHVASLMKQHRLFCQGEQRFPAALEHMRRVGHFEFGLDRRPIHTGDTDAVREIQELWDRGEEIRGWARYWAGLHGWLHQWLKADAALQDSVMVVRFEDLCRHTRPTLESLLSWCDLNSTTLVDEWTDRIQAPTYYQPDFMETDERIIAEETDAVAERFGYGAEQSAAEETAL